MKPANEAASVDCKRKSIGPSIPLNGPALASLMSQYSPVLYRTALRQLRNPEDAEDAVQDALLSAFKHRSQFEGRSQISTWLTRIVINSAHMQLRRRPRDDNVSLNQFQEDDDFVVADQFVDPGPSPEKIFEKAELHEIVNQLLKQLSPMSCRAFQLCQIDGLSTSEAAQVLGVTGSALKARIFRARAKFSLLLRTALGPGESTSKR